MERVKGTLNCTAAVMAALILGSCIRPDTYETFIRACDAGEEGVYEFKCALDDSLATYDISFYTATPVLDPLGLNVEWRSPSGTPCLSEKVYMQTSGARQLYRSGAGVSEYGEWTISVKPDSVSTGFRGLGIICKRIDGTR